MKKLALSAAVGLSMASGLIQAATLEELEQRIAELETMQLSQHSVSSFDLRVSGFVNVVATATDQGSQYTSHDWSAFLKASGLEGSMSRRGNCHDNAVAESFFQLLKRERVKRKIYTSRDVARADVFDYIEMFYNNRRRHSSNELLSPVEYERRHQERLGSV